MSAGGSCDQGFRTLDGVTYLAIPLGNEAVFRDRQDQIPEVCNDCNARRGGFHHALCDLEECPICGTLALTCGCIT